MPQVRTLLTTVADASIKTEAQARAAFWDRMETANGGREGDPRDYISIIEPVVRDARGFVFRYEVPAEVLDGFRALEGTDVLTAPGPVRPKCHVLSCMRPCMEGSSYCDQHQDKSSRFKDTTQPTQLMPSLILVTGFNPRKAFDRNQLEDLKASIKEHGIIEPLLVRPKGNSRYELVVGERRLRAARELSLEHVPVTVRQLTDEQVLDIMLAENLQRVDLNPIEEAHHLKRVLEVGKLTQTELGRRVGKSQEWVSQRLRLAEAPAALQDLIIRRQINTSSAIEVLQWKNTEHYDAIMHEIGAWSVEGEELPRARVREFIKEITEPAPTPYGSIPMPVAPDVKEGEIQAGTMVRLNADGTVTPVEPIDDEEDGCEMFGEPGAADDEVCAVDCPDYEECKSAGEEEEDDDEDQDRPHEPEPVDETEGKPSAPPRNNGVPLITCDRTVQSYNGQMVGNSNGNISIRSGPEGAHTEIDAVVAEAIGCAEGDAVPVTVYISRGTIAIKRRGKF